MRTFYIIVISVLLVVIGAVLYPILHINNTSVDTTKFLPLTTTAVASYPYVFLGLMVYSIWSMWRK